MPTLAGTCKDDGAMLGEATLAAFSPKHDPYSDDDGSDDERSRSPLRSAPAYLPALLESGHTHPLQLV